MPPRPKDGPTKPLRELRQSKHWSVTTLAELAEVDRGTIWRIETGKGKNIPHPRTRKAIARALGVEPGDIAEFVQKKET